MADVHILGFGQFRRPVVMTPVTLHPTSRTVAAPVQPSVSQWTTSPTATAMGTQPVVQELALIPVVERLPQPLPMAEPVTKEGFS